MSQAKYRAFLVGLLVALGAACATPVGVPPGENLQAVLDAGKDLVLMPGRVYELTETLRYTTKGQKIYTGGAEFPAQYATLRIADPQLMMLVNGSEIEDVHGPAEEARLG